MAQDQERNYEDEELNYTDESVDDTGYEEQMEDEPRSDEIDDMRYFVKLLGILRSAIESGTSIPLTGKKIIDGDRCLMILDDLDDNMPDAIQYGLQVYQQQTGILDKAINEAKTHYVTANAEAENLIKKGKMEYAQLVGDAHEEADQIMADAQARAEAMVAEDEIVRQANDMAQSILNDARLQANKILLDAQQTAYEILSSVNGQLTEATRGVRQRLEDLGRNGQ